MSGPEPDKIHRVHAKVFASLIDGEVTIHMLPDHGQANARWDVPISIVPFESRIPNSLIWVTFSFSKGVIKIEPRDANDKTPMS
jgi:hypothetical protein